MNSQTICEIVENDFDLNGLLKEMTSKTSGAVVIFTGIVRGITEKGVPVETSALVYEAYKPMAIKMMNKIADEMRMRWPQIESIAIQQKIGSLYPGDVSVVIACSTPHRNDGVFEAARFGIDRLKEIVPVWKKEINSSGEVWIEGKYTPQPSDQ